MSAQLDHRAEDVAQFFYDLTPQERRDRFGLPGGSTIDWLLERIARDANRAAFAARIGGLPMSKCRTVFSTSTMASSG